MLIFLKIHVITIIKIFYGKCRMVEIAILEGDSSQWHIIDTFLLVISWFSRCPIYGAFDLQFRSELGRKKSISPFRDDIYCFYFLNPRWKNINEFFFKFLLLYFSVYNLQLIIFWTSVSLLRCSIVALWFQESL